MTTAASLMRWRVLMDGVVIGTSTDEPAAMRLLKAAAGIERLSGPDREHRCVAVGAVVWSWEECVTTYRPRARRGPVPDGVTALWF